MADEKSQSGNALFDAILTHRESLVPSAPRQLFSLWGDLQGAPASVVDEIVAARIQSEDFAHFRRQAPATPQPAALPQSAPHPGSLEAIAERMRAERSQYPAFGLGAPSGAPAKPAPQPAQPAPQKTAPMSPVEELIAHLRQRQEIHSGSIGFSTKRKK